MSTIDRQRVAAVRAMEGLGYTFTGSDWESPAGNRVEPTENSLRADADAMHALLVLRADKLDGCTEGSDEGVEFKLIAETISGYEAKRWPDGSVPRGKR